MKIEYKIVMMKKIGLILLMLGSFQAFAQPKPKTDTEQIAENDNVLNGLHVKHKAAKALNFFADDFILTTVSGEKKDKRTVVTEMSSPSVRFDKYETLDRQIKVDGITAVLTGTLHQMGARNGESFDIKLQIKNTWIKVGNIWKLSASQESAP